MKFILKGHAFRWKTSVLVLGPNYSNQLHDKQDEPHSEKFSCRLDHVQRELSYFQNNLKKIILMLNYGSK